MKLLTKNTDYAVRALIYLGFNKTRFISSREIAEKENIPVAYIRRILQELAKVGFIETKEGIKGGVKLKKMTKDIYLDEIIRIFQGEIQLADCMFQKKICGNRKVCVLRKRIKNIEEKVISEFSGITINTLISDLKKEK